MILLTSNLANQQSSTSHPNNEPKNIIVHLSKFIPPGSTRIWSGLTGSLNNIAFKTPDGKKVLVVENDGVTDATFAITYKGQHAKTTLQAGAVATYVW